MKLETTKERVLEAAKCSASDERMLRKLHPEAFEDKFDSKKIYASCVNLICSGIGIRKLHSINDRWAFISFNNSDSCSTGNHATAEVAIARQKLYGVTTFDTQKEFFKWALKQLE